jgi:hypothetical protein
MANMWNRGTVSAEEILGMKPEDLRSRLDAAATKDDVTAAVTAANEETKNTLAALQESIAKLSAPASPVRTTEEPLDPTTAILTDPNAYIREQTAGVNETALSARADVQEMRARQSYGGIFAKYGEDLMKTAANFSLEQRSKPGFWDFHIRSFMGDKYIKGDTEGSYPSTLGAGSFTSGITPPEDANKGLDPQVAAFLKERGVPLDKAALLNKTMIKDGEPVNIDTYRKAS